MVNFFKNISFIVLLCFTVSYAQQGWFTLHTVQGSTNYTGLQFINSLTGYIITSYGNAHINGGETKKTTNGGLNWYTVQSGVSNYSLFFLNENTGWVTGGYWTDECKKSREVFRTTNGGVNFIRIYIDSVSNTNKYIYFTNVNTGYILTSYPSQILKTTNSGFNWFISNELSVNSIYFVNISTGWASANNGVLYKTTNGAVDWSSQTLGSNEYLTKVIFIDVNTGWVTGNLGKVFKTTNSGINWQANNTGLVEINTVDFFNENTGWAAGYGGKAAYTSNGGINWIIQNTGNEHVFNFIDFADDDTGYVTGMRTLDPNTVEVILMKTVSAGLIPVKNSSYELPIEYKLYQNYPNPFNPVTKINFAIPGQANVKVNIYDLLGREVAALVNSNLNAGYYSVDFNGTNYPSGVYFYKLMIGEYCITKKMVLTK